MNLRFTGNSKRDRKEELRSHNQRAKRDLSFVRIFRFPEKVSKLDQIIGLLVVFFCLINGAYADFMVQPMKIDLTLRPGTLEPYAITLENRSQEEVYYVDLSVLELSQYEDGRWHPIDPNQPLSVEDSFDFSKASSCRSWINIRNKGTINIDPMGMKQVKVDIRVSAGVRGFYCAAIKASLLPRPDQVGVGLRYDFIIPVLIRIEGPPLRHRIQFHDCGLESQVENGGDDVSTFVTLDIENIGQTYSNLDALAQVQARLNNDNWRTIIREMRFDSVGIIPGSHLRLKKRLDRALPSGQYNVKSVVYVDGKQGKLIENQINFISEHSGPLKADAVIKAIPRIVQLEASPGLGRREILEVRNDSSDPVTIRAYTVVPKALEGRFWGNIRAEEFSCSKWIEIRPNEIKLKPYTRKNIGIRARMPEDIQSLSSYYADLNLYASYADGTNAGSTTAQICVTNKEKAPSYEALVKRLEINEMDREKSTFLVVATAMNLGDIYINPKCTASLIEPDNTVIRTQELKSSQSSYILPYESRNFAEVLDLSVMKEGVYRLEALLTYGEDETVREGKTVQIFIEGNRREVKVISEQSFQLQTSKEPVKVGW